MGKLTAETLAKVGKAPKRDRTPTRCAVEVVSVVSWVKEHRGNHEPITTAGENDDLTSVTGMWATGGEGGATATVRRRCWRATAATAAATRAKAGSAFIVPEVLVSEKFSGQGEEKKRRKGRKEGGDDAGFVGPRALVPCLRENR